MYTDVNHYVTGPSTSRNYHWTDYGLVCCIKNLMYFVVQ